jgi:hypothetical protein
MSEQPQTGSSGGKFTAWDGSLTPPSATSEQPQEWTVEDGWLRSPDGEHFSGDHLDRIAAAINAALAAERERYQDTEADGVVFCGKCGSKL